jgi:hypothetical protein
MAPRRNILPEEKKNAVPTNFLARYSTKCACKKKKSEANWKMLAKE